MSNKYKQKKNYQRYYYLRKYYTFVHFNSNIININNNQSLFYVYECIFCSILL